MPKKPSRRTTKKKAKPKARSKPKAVTRRKKKPPLRPNLIKAACGLVILILMVMGAGLFFNHLLKPPPRVAKAPPKKVHTPAPPAAVKAPPRQHTTKKEKQAAAKPPAPGEKPRKQASTPGPKPPVYEIYPEEEIPLPPARPSKPPPSGLPEVAIIIDDVGYDRAMAEKFIRLDDRLTLSIFPYAPYRHSIAKMARQHGLGLMLHLPMEPNEYPRVNPGPGKLLTNMTPDQLIAQLNRDLDQVPGIQGVNNHMGSKLTARSSQMNQIFTILKKRGYFFIDSRTTKDTVCRSSARLLKVPFAQRKVFLDHTLDPETIRRQIRQLVRYARKYGVAVGIGHPHAVTYRILKEELPRLRKKVRLVRASQIVHVIS